MQANTKYASFVMEEVSGRVLYARNADKQLYPASLSKIMTLYILFEELQSKNLTLNSQIPISSLSASRSPSKLYLKPGEMILTLMFLFATSRAIDLYKPTNPDFEAT